MVNLFSTKLKHGAFNNRMINSMKVKDCQSFLRKWGQFCLTQILQNSMMDFNSMVIEENAVRQKSMITMFF